MMKSKRYIYLLLAVVAVLAFQFCTKKLDGFSSAAVSEYYPLEVGKYIVYRLDSTVFTNFETTEEVHSYQVKDIVEGNITDNIGRPSFRIRRMIRDSAGLNPWADNASFMVTPLPKSVEYVEDNNRFIKLQAPIKENFYWQGNSYISDNISYLTDWNYTYTSVEQPYTVNNVQLDNTVTILQIADSTGDPVLFPNSIASKTYSVEIYGKEIGLVYKDFIHWIYQKNNTLNNCRIIVDGQPNATQCPANLDCDSLARAMNGYVKCDTISSRYSYDGFGIKLTMLEHN